MSNLNDPGDEDDGEQKLAEKDRKLSTRVCQPMVMPSAGILRMNFYYGTRVIEYHDSGDEDRRDIRPVMRPHRPWTCRRGMDYARKS
jgi:hypothetical protein